MARTAGVVVKASADAVGVVRASGTGGARARGGSGFAGEVMAGAAFGVGLAITDAVDVVFAGGTGGARATGRSGCTGKLMARTAGVVVKASADAVGVVCAGATRDVGDAGVAVGVVARVAGAALVGAVGSAGVCAAGGAIGAGADVNRRGSGLIVVNGSDSGLMILGELILGFWRLAVADFDVAVTVLYGIAVGFVYSL
jgi:hypothetical protein